MIASKTASSASAPRSNIEILQAVSRGELSADDASKLLKTASRTAGAVSFKVSEKGAVSVYGLNARFPTTLYGDQWARLLDQADALRKFIADNQGKLSIKE